MVKGLLWIGSILWFLVLSTYPLQFFTSARGAIVGSIILATSPLPLACMIFRYRADPERRHARADRRKRALAERLSRKSHR